MNNNSYYNDMKFTTFCIMFLIGWLMMACRPSDNYAIQAYAFQVDSLNGWGLVSTKGQMILPAGTYPLPPSTVVNDMFTVPDSTGRLSLYHIDQPFRPVCLRTFERIGHFFEDVTPAQETESSPILLIDKKGNTVYSTAQYIPHKLVYMHNFSDGRALVATEQGKYGYIDVNGYMIIPPIYTQAFDFNEGLALVAIANQQGELGYQLIDKEGNIRLAIQQSRVWLGQEIHNGLLQIKNLDTRQSHYLRIDGKNTLFLPQEVTEAFAFQQGTAIIRTHTGMGIIDMKGNILLQPQFTQIKQTNTENIHVKYNQQWALFSQQGKNLSDFFYDYLGDYYADGLTIAGKNQHYFFINAHGKTIDDNIYTRLVVDSTALRFTSQTFLQQLQESTTLTKKQEKQTDVSEKKRRKETLENTPNQVALSNQPSATNNRHIIQADEWKNIQQNSPFYDEARKILAGKLKENDAKNRRMILNYVEHLRMAYITKDIDFLEQTFSENALIIVGKVIQSEQQPEGGYLTPDLVLYNVKSKRQYLNRLKQIFLANKKINVKFSNFHIMRHPTQQGIYGVSLRQGYRSDLYSDDGYLFLLWDFRDASMPKIHVRTWQPSMLNEHTPLPEDEIFNISNFHLN